MALALQIGSEVNYQDLAQTVGTDGKTIDRYIDLLEKAFVVFRLPALNRNVRNEIKMGKKVFFYDCGIRNAVINNFKPLATRTDVGALWENFVISERMKMLAYQGKDVKQYFWRTTQQQEIDLVEENDNEFSAYKIKWNPRQRVRFSNTFTSNYPGTKTLAVSPSNIEEFLVEN